MKTKAVYTMLIALGDDNSVLPTHTFNSYVKFDRIFVIYFVLEYTRTKVT